jgi:hypothetical protein
MVEEPPVMLESSSPRSNNDKDPNEELNTWELDERRLLAS